MCVLMNPPSDSDVWQSLRIITLDSLLGSRSLWDPDENYELFPSKVPSWTNVQFYVYFKDKHGQRLPAVVIYYSQMGHIHWALGHFTYNKQHILIAYKLLKLNWEKWKNKKTVNQSLNSGTPVFPLVCLHLLRFQSWHKISWGLTLQTSELYWVHRLNLWPFQWRILTWSLFHLTINLCT